MKLDVEGFWSGEGDGATPQPTLVQLALPPDAAPISWTLLVTADDATATVVVTEGLGRFTRERTLGVGTHVVVGRTIKVTAKSGAGIAAAVVPGGGAAASRQDGEWEVLDPEAASAFSQLAQNVASAQFLAANSDRLGIEVINDSAAILYLKWGGAAAVGGSNIKVLPGGYWSPPVRCTEALHGIWDAAGGGEALVTQYTKA